MRAYLASLVASYVLIAVLGASAFAHEGHDHNEQRAPVAAAAPRGEANSADFELVALSRGGELTIYLDRFGTNEPVLDASMEVETPSGPAKAVTNADGTYRLPAPWAKAAGHYDLIFTVIAGSQTDVLTLSIDVPPANPENPVALTGKSWLGSLAGLSLAIGCFFLGILAALYWQRKRTASAAFLFGLFTALAVAPEVRAHEGHDHKEERPSSSSTLLRDVAQRLPDGTIFVPKSAQRLLAIRTVVVATGDHFKSIELPGKISLTRMQAATYSPHWREGSLRRRKVSRCLEAASRREICWLM